MSYALDSILVLHSKAWIQLEQIFSSHRYQSQVQKQQKLLKAQGGRNYFLLIHQKENVLIKIGLKHASSMVIIGGIGDHLGVRLMTIL